MLVFDLHIPLVRRVADLTPLQRTYLILEWNRRHEPDD
jgi:hypothetical protein